MANIKCPTRSITLGRFLFNQAAKYGNNICQIDINSKKSETYASVNKRSVRLAMSLHKNGLSPNDVVLICSRNTLDNAIPLTATLYLAAKPVFLDPSISPRSAKHLISTVSPKIIFVEESAVCLIEEAVANTELDLEIIVLGNSNKYQKFSSLTVSDPQENIFKPTEIDVNDSGVMFFSSGTSGLPKAICHSHKSFLQTVLNFNFMITENISQSTEHADVNFHFTSFDWISGMVLFFGSFLTGGARIFSQNIDGETMLKMIEVYKISFLFLSPLYTYQLTNVKNPERYDFSCVRILMTGGTPLSLQQYKRLNNLFKCQNIVFCYGLTEVFPVTRYDSKINKSDTNSKNTPCGRLFPGNLLKIVDAETQETLGSNSEGEIRVKSKSMMLGYHKLDSASYFDNDGFYKTGDLGYFDENGYLHVVGRLKEMFKFLGWHIIPSLIEAVVLEHPAVAEAMVFRVPHEKEGEVPAACVVLEEGTTCSPKEVEEFVAGKVVDREKLRGGVYFVDSLPKTSSGKFIRNEARARILKTTCISSE